MCSRKKSSTPTPVSSCQRKCSFCHRDVEDTLLYGEMISKERIVAHYYCVVSVKFSKNLLRGRIYFIILLNDVFKWIDRT